MKLVSVIFFLAAVIVAGTFVGYYRMKHEIADGKYIEIDGKMYRVKFIPVEYKEVYE